MLAPLDIGIIVAYLLGALAVGAYVTKRASSSREEYFLAGRRLPWWWAGASIAATTFAADTPLAVTGIIAERGLSGNWMWLSWVVVHAGVVVYFAVRWSRAGVTTDAELVSLRYEGRSAEGLRLFRAGLYGLVFNVLVLGWVLKAMVKIATPFFDWARWTPGLVGALAAVWPDGSSFGTPAEGLTVLLLLLVVAIYSSAGGLAGVVITDLFQLGLALFGSIYFATAALARVGGTAELRHSLTRLYGDEHRYLDLIPQLQGGWIEAAGLGAFSFGLYLVVQSFANLPADGGGYLMQRLSATRSPRDARRAALFFVLLQYLVRVWPWFVVGLCALVLMPLGNEGAVFGDAVVSVAQDRESAYPRLMQALLPTGMLGLVVASLLAAFMSTVDTHLNWGASYVVTDVLPKLRQEHTERQRVLIARLAVLGFSVTAVAVSFQIESIAVAWQWIWWRVTAWAELGSAGAGLLAGLLLSFVPAFGYELRLVLIAAVATVVCLATIYWGPSADPEAARRFATRVGALGFWPDRSARQASMELGARALEMVAILGGVLLGLVAGHRLLLLGDVSSGVLYAAIACLLLWLPSRGLKSASPS